MADVSPSRKTSSLTSGSTGGSTSGKVTQKKQTGTSSASNKSVKEKTVSDSDLQSKIMAALSDIKKQQASTDAKFTELVNRVTVLEDTPLEYGYEDYGEEGELEEGEMSNVSRPQKRHHEDSSRFSQMTKRLKGQVNLGPSVQDTLACNINDVFINGLKEDEYSNMIKEESLPRPENCEALQTVKCNKIVWDFLPTNTKFVDKKLQNTETSIIKAAIFITQAVDSMAKAEDQIKEVGIDISSPLDNCQDALSLLGHANKQLNMTRREALRPEMRRPYSSLCSSMQPYNEWLFGDIEKSAKEIEDTAKIGHKIQHDTRTVRGRPLFRGRSLRGRSFSGYRIPHLPSSDYGRTGSQFQDPKNLRRNQGPPRPVRKQ